MKIYVLPMINVAVLRERRGLVEEGTTIGLDLPRNTNTLVLYSSSIFPKAAEHVTCTGISFSSILNFFGDGRIEVFLFTWTSKLSLSWLLFVGPHFAFCASSILQHKMGSNDTSCMVFTPSLICPSKNFTSGHFLVVLMDDT